MLPGQFLAVSRQTLQTFVESLKKKTQIPMNIIPFQNQTRYSLRPPLLYLGPEIIQKPVILQKKKLDVFRFLSFLFFMSQLILRGCG